MKVVADDALEQNGDAVRLQRAMEKLSVWLGQTVNGGRAALNSLRISTIEKNDLKSFGLTAQSNANECGAAK